MGGNSIPEYNVFLISNSKVFPQFHPIMLWLKNYFQAQMEQPLNPLKGTYPATGF